MGDIMNGIKVLRRSNAPVDLLNAASEYKKKLPDGHDFLQYIIFQKDYLDKLPDCVIKHCDESRFPKIFSSVANNKRVTRKMREQYLSALLSAYRKMRKDYNIGKNAILIAPQREGAYLARKLGINPKSGYLPHAKRIHYHHGIAIGLDSLPEAKKRVRKAVIIDGAIASGSTLMAIMGFLKQNNITDVEVYSVHSTEKSLFILDSFARENGIKLRVNIAYISGILNEHFYAVYPHNPKRVVMGDLGDTISDL